MGELYANPYILALAVFQLKHLLVRIMLQQNDDVFTLNHINFIHFISLKIMIAI